MPNLSSIHFPTSYQGSRTYFRVHLERIKKIWPGAEYSTQLISAADDLTIDWITANPIKKKQRLILITTGLHGVEGFVGAAMLDVFVKEFISRLDPQETGIQLVHAVNPWGMANIRRVNSNNVDLNRNFMEDEQDFQSDFNPEYKMVEGTLNPRHSLKSFWSEDLAFLKNVITDLVRHGVRKLRGAVLLGQQSSPNGLYYAGQKYQVETTCLMNLIRESLSSYSSVLQIDMHSGYGPSDQMTLVNSPAEERTMTQLRKEFNYPRVLQADPDQFYSMQGDMIDWVYRLHRSDYPGVKFYGTAFEFGTYGEGILKEIKSLRTMVYENQAAHHGATSAKMHTRMRDLILEMYNPRSHHWREKALVDCRQALTGILGAGGYF
jgi:hypothetical protein